MSVDKPRWLTDAIAAAERSLETDRGPYEVGPACAKGGGWFEVDLRGVRYDPDMVAEATLVSRNGLRHSLVEIVLDGSTLRVRVAEHAPAEGLVLCVEREHRVGQALVNGLSALTPTALTEAFARGELRPVRPAEAKGKAIGRLIENLMEEGRTALLVSGTNVTLDEVVLRVAGQVNPEPGAIIRVGTPHLREVADDERLCLNRLLKDALAVLDQKAAALSEEILSLRDQAAVRRLIAARRQLEGFDERAYEEARRRVRNRNLAVILQEKLDEVGAALSEARIQGERDRLAAETAEEEWEATADSRRVHEEVRAKLEAKQQRYEACRAEERRRADSCLRLEEELGRLNRGLFGRMQHFAERQELESRLLAAQRLADRAEEECEALKRELDAFRAEPTHAEHGAAEIERRKFRLQESAEAFKESSSRERTLAARQEDLTLELDDLGDLPEPQDAELVAEANREGLPALHGRMVSLTSDAEEPLRRISELEAEHEKLMAERRKTGCAAARDLVEQARVIATTHALLRLREDVHTRSYDYVIVDEAAGTTDGEVLYALGRGLEGAVLF
jgi:hypothetical protein